MLLNVDPYLFKWGFLEVRWYGFFMAVSILLGALFLYRTAMARGISEDFILNLMIICVLGGVVGARLLFVISNFPQWFWQSPYKIVQIWEGGLSWHGGLLGGFLPAWWYCRRNGINVSRIADWVVPGLAVGYLLVRIGNIFNREVLGRSTELWFQQWPAQLVGSAIGLVLLIRFFYLRRYKLPPGYQFWSFVFYHQLFRGIFEETVRDNPLYVVQYVNNSLGFGLMTVTQWITPPLLIFAWWMWKRSGQYAAEQ